MKQKTIVMLSTTDWDAPQFGSRQQIALQLAKRGHQVLFVDQPRALHSLITDWHKSLVQMHRWLSGGLRQPVLDLPKLYVYAPPPVLPIFYHPWTNPLSQRILKLAIRRTLRRLGWQTDIFWTYWANSSDLIGSFGERLAVYHCIDDFTVIDYPLVKSGIIAQLEATLCRRVDLIFARTEELTAAKRQFNPNTCFLPGGVDIDLFDPTQVPNLPADIASLPKPRIGLVGTLDNRLDIELLVYCAQNLPEASFVFVGPVKRHLINLNSLEELPNVHFFSARPHTEIPAVVATFDTCLIPYRVTPYTEGVSPLKLYEYLAMGKPVIATNLPYLRREANHIRLASTPEAFLAQVKAALATPPEAKKQAQWRSVSEGYSWENQVNTIEHHLAQLVNSKER